MARQPKQEKQPHLAWRITRTVLDVLGKIILVLLIAVGTVALIAAIAGSIFLSKFKSYVELDIIPKAEEYAEGLELDNISLAQTSIIYYTDPKTGEYRELQQLYGEQGSYAQALAAQQEANRANVQKAVGSLQDQKRDTETSYANMFRQLYLNKMKSQKNIGQQLAAQGKTGGAAESTMLGLDTSYSDALRQGEQGRIGALGDLDRDHGRRADGRHCQRGACGGECQGAHGQLCRCAARPDGPLRPAECAEHGIRAGGCGQRKSLRL